MGGKTYCCIPGCPITRKRPKIENGRTISLFSSPSNEEQLALWSKATEIIDKKLKLGDKVCELHFTEDNISKFYETVLPDGTVWRLERSRKVLKNGAVPTIFPNSNFISKKRKSPKALNNKKKSSQTRKTSSNEASKCKDVASSETPECGDVIKRNHSLTKTINPPESSVLYANVTPSKTPECRAVISNETPECRYATSNEILQCGDVISIKDPECREVISDMYDGDILESAEIFKTENSQQAKIVSSEMIETFSYNVLASNLELISKPDSLWGITVHDEFIMCAKWNENNALMKRVIIDYSLKIQVFFKNRAIDFDSVKMNSVKDLSSVLKEIDRCGICINANNIEKTGCDGYILPNSQTNMCQYCLLIGNWEMNQNRRKNLYWLNKGSKFIKHQILYDKIHTLNKKNMLLKEQLNKIIKIKAIWKQSK